MKTEQSGALYGGSRRFGEILLDEIEDQPADLGEELSVVPEKHSKALGQTERHESVWKTQEKIILGVFGEQEGSFLGTGRLRAPGPRWKPLQLKGLGVPDETTPLYIQDWCTVCGQL